MKGLTFLVAITVPTGNDQERAAEIMSALQETAKDFDIDATVELEGVVDL